VTVAPAVSRLPSVATSGWRSSCSTSAVTVARGAGHPEGPEGGLGCGRAAVGEVGFVLRGMRWSVEHQTPDGARRCSGPRGEGGGAVAHTHGGELFHPEGGAQQLDVGGRRFRAVATQTSVEGEVALLHDRARPFEQQGEVRFAGGVGVGVHERGAGILRRAVQDVLACAAPVEAYEGVVLQQGRIDLSGEYRRVPGGRLAGAVAEDEQRWPVRGRPGLPDADHPE
jgi:hypothetical protein